MTKYIIFAFLVLLCVYFTEQAQFLSHNYINEINNVAKTWKARQNFHPNTSIEFIKTLLGAKNYFKAGLVKEEDSLYVKDENVPKSFDARNQWEYCKTIKNIPNQGKCGSCWAFATSSAFSDRLCIATKGKFNEILSAQEMLSCCRYFGCFGCRGGSPIIAWNCLRKRGLVTGGGYKSNEGCQPYKIEPCVKDKQGKSSCAHKRLQHRGKCSKVCYGNETIDYVSDHYKTRNAYFLKSINIEKELIAYGSITAVFFVYEDFLSYSSGIYVKTKGTEALGGHAVKLIGWGEEDGVPYWLLINSWGPAWGDKGTFKIRRGTNECDIEKGLTAGIPLV